jgi:hypothetical protein
MSHEKKLSAIQAELTRQDETFARFKHDLETLGDVELQVHTAFFEDFADATTTTNANPTAVCFGIRA